MKKLLGLALTFLLSITCALALVACGGNKSNNDAEVADQAIGNIWSMYGDKDAKTPQDYTLVGQTRVEDAYYTVEWSVSENATNVVVGKMDPVTKLVTVSVTRVEVDVEYTLTASITVGNETRTKDFARVVPAAVVIADGGVTFDFTSVALGSTLNSSSAFELLNSVGGSDTGLVSVQVDKVYQGNGTGGGEYENKGGFIKMGTSSAGGTLTLVFEGKVDKVVIESMGWPSGSYTDKISVNGSEQQELSKSYSETFTFEFEATETVSIVSADRAFIFKIVVYYAEGAHRHAWTYEHIEGTWTHTKVCTAEGCDVTEPVTENCTPTLNVCSCGYTYSEEEILTALFALAKGAKLPGTYKLTGVITEVVEIGTSFGNATFWMQVGDKSVEAYRVSGNGYETVKVGYTVTVTGELIDYNGTKEFTQGGTITEIIAGEDNRTDAEKVAAAKAAVAGLISNSYKAKTTVTLPVENNGAELTWACADGKGLVTVEGGKLTIVALPEEATEVTLTVTIVCGDANDTAEVVITIYPAASLEHAGTLEDPYTVEDALAITNALESNAYYSENGVATPVHVAGYVIVIGSYNSQYSNWTGVYIADSADANKADGIQVYRLNNSTLIDSNTLTKGAYIVVYGYLQNFSGNTPEITYNGDTNVEVKAYELPENPPVENGTTLTFDDTAKRTTGTTEMQVWEENGIIFTNSKGASTSDVNTQYYNPVRLYKNSSVKIEYNGMTNIVFYCNTAAYATNLKSSLDAENISGITVTIDGTEVTVVFASATNSFEFVASANQIRLDSIEVNANLTSNPGGEIKPDPDEPEVFYGTEEKPLTVAEAIALATNECPSSNNVTAQVVYMKGVITDLGNFTGTYYQNMYFADAGKLDTTIFAYTINVNAGVTTPVVGDTVVICGYIKNYNGTLEFASNNGTFVYIVSNLGGGTSTPDPDEPDPTKPEFSPITSPVAGEYAMAMDINGTWYYLTGELSGNYAASTTNVAGAAKIELIADGDGWLIKANGKYVEIIISGTYNNIKFNAERATDIHWVWNAEYSIFTWTNTNDTFWMGTYNTYTTFSASKISYITNNNQYPAKLGTLGGSQGENPGGGEDTPSASASISFADAANRTSYSTTEQVWEQNGIKLTNSKGASTTNVGDYSNPIRIYANSTVKLEFTSAMKEIVFHCNNTTYANDLVTSLTNAGYTATANGKDVTVVLTTASNSIEFTAAKQLRFDSIDVKA